jgi:aspartyl-tRNA(Asn)/glutamyl-tRNA(Gln) amidotransferase subunit A
MYQLSALQIRDAFLKGEHSAEKIISYFLQRIEKYDPEIKSFLRIYNDRALTKAKELDEKKAQGKKLGKLAGIPIAIKDNIHVKGVPRKLSGSF